MLTETGKVVALDDGAVWVETLRQSTCGKCAARSGCGHAMLNQMAQGGSRGLVRARLSEGLATGIRLHDTVRIALPERSFLRGVAVLYLLPLLCTVVGAILADQFWVSATTSQSGADLRVALGALGGLGSGLLLLRGVRESQENDSSLQPRVTARLADPEAEGAREADRPVVPPRGR